MSIFNIFNKPPPPPPIYKRQPLATLAVILTIIATFVLGPIGVIYNSMSEELKGKADNETVILLIEQIKENDKRQWEEIQRNRDRKQITSSIISKSINRPASAKKTVPPEMFKTYLSLEPELRTKYKQYLVLKGYDVEGLPD